MLTRNVAIRVSENPKVLVFVATYNEKESILPLLDKISQSIGYADVLVIDDNSPDGTGNLLDARAKQDVRLRIIHRPGKMGLGTAILTGLRYAIENKYDYAVNLDGDFSHAPEDISRLMEKAETGFDIVIGSRYVSGGGIKNWSLLRCISSKAVNYVVRILLGLSSRDCSGAFRCYRVSAISSISFDCIRSKGYAFLEELLFRCQSTGCMIGEVPITFIDRKAGKSKVSTREAVKSLLDIFTVAATHRASVLTAFFLCLWGLFLISDGADHLGVTWHDASKMSTVEAIADFGTLAIDETTFASSTGDKIFVDGNYYSHQPPFHALLMAAPYKAIAWMSGKKIHGSADFFRYWLTMLTSGVSYLIALCGMYFLACKTGLRRNIRFLFAVSFGFSTMALIYAVAINSHIGLLAVSVLATTLVADTGVKTEYRRKDWVLGLLAGVGYAFDLGVGSGLLASSFFYLLYRDRSFKSILPFSLGVLPGFLAHHVLNYSIAGTILPVSMNPEYFKWTGSTFTSENLTGSFKHASIGTWFVYLMKMLFGDRGFISHNVVLYLLIPSTLLVLRRHRSLSPRAVFALVWILSTIFVYSVGSNNFSGLCWSIRWFVPLLAPIYLLFLELLDYDPTYILDFSLLTVWGIRLTMLGWEMGAPWYILRQDFFERQGMILFSWLLLRIALWVTGYRCSRTFLQNR